MGTHVALLRGINVGGKNRLPMADVVRLFERAGASDVVTYIQSGNVVFCAPKTEGLAAKIEKAIVKEVGFEVPIVLRAAEELAALVGRNPFLKRGISADLLHVGFLADEPDVARVAGLDRARSPGDSFEVLGSEVFLHLPNGVARSKLTNAWFDSKLATTTTVRNWRTVTTLVEMSGRKAPDAERSSATMGRAAQGARQPKKKG
jgi:uncharacterized protein (DUF1697 family)